MLETEPLEAHMALYLIDRSTGEVFDASRFGVMAVADPAQIGPAAHGYGIDDPLLAVWFTPEAVRQHFDARSADGDDPVAGMDDAALLRVAGAAMDDPLLWAAYHEVLEAAVARVRAETASKCATIRVRG